MTSGLRAGVRLAVLAATLCAGGPALAQEAEPSPLLIRIRAVGLLPVVEATSPVGGDIEVTDAWVPELDVSWFASHCFALELVLGVTKHGVRVARSRIGDLDLGRVRVFPATLMAQFHPAAYRAPLQPYLGIGASWAVFHDGKAPGPLITSVEYENALGLALQAGLSARTGGGPWTVNVDVKKAFLDTAVSLDGGFLTADVAINPWIIGIGLGYRPIRSD